MPFSTPEKYRRKVTVQFNEEDFLTEQHHRDTVNIHSILKRFEITGIMDHVNQYEGQYVEMLDPPDYHEAQNKIAMIDDMFMTLPASLRREFENDPGKFVEYMNNPDNYEDIIEKGLNASHLSVAPDRDRYNDPVPQGTEPDTAPRDGHEHAQAQSTKSKGE